MKVAGLWRYPVKSMQGEFRDSVVLDNDGVEGDRRFGVLDPASGTIISAKKDGRLLEARAMLVGVELTVLSADQSKYLGIPVDGPYKSDQYRY